MRIVGVLSGVAALAAFFLPWVDGVGPLAGLSFSGYELVGYTGALRQLESLNPVLVTVAQVSTLLVAIAATWLTILAAMDAWQPLRRVCGGYLLAVGAVLLTINSMQANLHAGAGTVAFAGVVAVSLELRKVAIRRLRRVVPVARPSHEPAVPVVV
jgi:hypothetical protein